MATSPKPGAAKKMVKAQRPAKRASRSSATKAIDDAEHPSPAEPESSSSAPPQETPAAQTPDAEQPNKPSPEPMTPEPAPAPQPATKTEPEAPSPAPAPAAPAPSPLPAQMQASAPPTPVPAAPQWTTTPAPPPAIVPQPAPVDAALRDAAHRRGMPGLVVLGTCMALLGLLIMLITFYLGQGHTSLPRMAGVRGDYLGVVLLLLGVGVAGTFVFVPPARAYGLGPGASRDELETEMKTSHGRMRLSQAMVATGLALVAIGLFWMLWWVYVAYREGGFRSSILGNYDIPTHYFGAILVLLGLALTLFFWGAVAAARRRHNLATVLLFRASGTPAANSNLASGVTDQEVQNLMRRLDALMAQLPDTAVTEFSKTPEADTYLRLLGP